MIGLSFTGMGDFNGRNREGENLGEVALINDSSYKLKKIIKTHTVRLDFVDIIKPTFLQNAVATIRQRRVIASKSKATDDHVGVQSSENSNGFIQ